MSVKVEMSVDGEFGVVWKCCAMESFGVGDKRAYIWWSLALEEASANVEDLFVGEWLRWAKIKHCIFVGKVVRAKINRK
jgi:hypothetical protein